MLNFCDFIQVYVFTTNHHLKKVGFFKNIDDFVRRCITKKFFYSFCGIIFRLGVNDNRPRMFF